MKHIFTLLAFALLSSGLAQVPGYVPTDGLLTWESFETPEVNCLTGGDTPCALGNLTADRFDYSALETTGSCHSLPSANSGGNEWTFSTWIKAYGGQEIGNLFRQHWDGGNWLRFEFSNLIFRYGNESHRKIETPSGQLLDGSWHFVVVRVSPESISMWQDGILVVSTSGDLMDSYNEPFTIGSAIPPGDSEFDGCAEHFFGAMDDIGVWERALTDQEILALYNAPAPTVGCTDSYAGNFNPNATIDNGTCEDCHTATPEIVSSFGETALLSAPDLASNVTWSTGEVGQQIEVSESGFYSSEWSLELSGVDSALGFVEPNAWMSIPSLVLPQEYTLQVWAHFPLPETADGHNTIFSDSNTGGAADLVHLFFHESCGLGVGDQYQSGNCVAGGVYGTGVLASEVSEGWHMITASSTPAGTTFFIDDAEVGSVSHQVSGPIVAVGNNAGGNGVAPQQAGVLSQARVWGGAMTSEHVAEAFHCNIASIDLELLAHWALDDAYEGGVDLSGGGQSGTLQNVSSPVETTYCFSCETKEWAVDFPEPNCGAGTVWDAVNEECVVANPSDTDFDGCVGMIDLLDLLSVFGTCAETESEPEPLEWSCGDPLGYQGYDYETVQIGEQCWFAENLRSEIYANGDSITANLNDDLWTSTTCGAMSVYGQLGSNCTGVSPDGDACTELWSLNEFGRLYNWYAVDDDRGLCPNGWHVPSDGEWMSLELYLGMTEAEINNTGSRGDDEGAQMKAEYGWFENGAGPNCSGFTGLPGGHRHPESGDSVDAGWAGSWWSASSDGSQAWNRYLLHYLPRVCRDSYSPRYGFSVRCIQDSE